MERKGTSTAAVAALSAPGVPVGGGPLRLISDSLPIENYVTRSATPDLSPDGKSLVFSARTGPREYAIELIDLASGARKRLGAAAGRGPRFAPDGRHIYAIGRYPESTSPRDGGDSPLARQAPPLRLWRFDLAGKPEPVFTFPHTAVDRYTAVSRDGNWFYYFAEIPVGGHNWQVWRADLNGKTAPMPVTALQDTPPRFGFALAPDSLQLAASLNRVNSNVMLVETGEEKK